MDATRAIGSLRRGPFDTGEGKSGSALERVTLDDGRELVLKHEAPDDLVARVVPGGADRIGVLWDSGVLERAATVVDHGIVGVERDGNEWLVFMRDVSHTLLPETVDVSRAAAPAHRASDRAAPRRLPPTSRSRAVPARHAVPDARARDAWRRSSTSATSCLRSWSAVGISGPTRFPPTWPTRCSRCTTAPTISRLGCHDTSRRSVTATSGSPTSGSRPTAWC